MDLINIIATIVVICATIYNVYLTYYKYRQETPVLDIKMDNLPPYSSDNIKTVIIVKNVGKKKTNMDFETTVNCSWISGLSYKLNLPNERYFLAPNEEIVWKLKIDQEVPDNGILSVIIKDRSSKMTWEYHEQVG